MTILGLSKLYHYPKNRTFAYDRSCKYSLVMRSGVVSKLCCFLLIIVLVPLLPGQSSPVTDDTALTNAHQLFRQAVFRGAAVAFSNVVDTMRSGEGLAGLVRSVVNAGG
jgi:hypothetical protein